MPAKKRIARRPSPKLPVSAAHATAENGGLLGLRLPQQEFFDSPERVIWLLARRQFGKSYLFGAMSLDLMMSAPETEVLIVSASLRLGQENLRKEAKVWRDVISKMKLLAEVSSSVDDDNGNVLDIDAIADMLEAQKLVVTLHHSNTQTSRTMTVAPNPDTAVGFTSNLILDEVGRMPEFRDLWEAVEPIVSSNANLRVFGATTPPPDDSHFSYELLLPPPGFSPEINPQGNWYRNKEGHNCLRVTAWDAEAAGVPLLDLRTGKPIAPAAARAKASDKSAWDRNYGCEFVRGGTSAISLLFLHNACMAGAGDCVGINFTDRLEEAA